MRTSDERFELIKGRAKELKRAELRRKTTLLTVLAVVLCPALAIAVALAAPSMVSPDTEFAYNGMAASVFANSPVLASITVGVIAFALGVTVTVLCYKIRQMKDGEDGDKL